MRRLNLVFLIFITTFSSCVGQNKMFKELSNKLELNAFVYSKTDAATFEFLKIYIPYLTKKLPKGISFTPPVGLNAQRSMHSIIFKKHPYFDFKISEGRLDFLTVEVDGGTIVITDTKLWLIFDNRNDAEITFKKLTDLFSPLSEQINISEANGRKIAKFVGKKPADEFDRAKIMLTTDEIDPTKYKILFHTPWHSTDED